MSVVDAQKQRPRAPGGASAAGLKAAVRAHVGALRADRRYDRLLRALPIVVEAPRSERDWRSALVGPTTEPSGYRDSVVLGGGRLVRAPVRQRHRDGNIHVDPIAEVRRAFGRAFRGAVDVTRDRRPLVPLVHLDENWLSEAARRHDVPISPSLIAELLPRVRSSADDAKRRFRTKLDVRVAELLLDDESLALFHDWLADESISQEIRRRRQDAFAAVGPACRLIKEDAAIQAHLDAGEDAGSLLAEMLEAPCDAVLKLVRQAPHGPTCVGIGHAVGIASNRIDLRRTLPRVRASLH
jgi:hypothetical protein